MCLLQNEVCPIFLNRHVLKYMLGRKIGWHDLAFFDHTMYESLRELVLESEVKESSIMFSALDLTFCVELGPEEVSISTDVSCPEFYFIFSYLALELVLSHL